MINAEQAHQIAQMRNRDLWVNDEINKIFKFIEESAKKGFHECKIYITFKGAEDLYEISTMLCMIANVLEDNGFEHYVTLEGELVIQW